MTISRIGETKISTLVATGPLLASEQDALDVIGETYGGDVDVVVVPLGRLAPDFWELRNGKAGAFIQKFTNYQLGLAFVGDLSAATAGSKALTDFVRESNRRGAVLFAVDLEELSALLGRRRG